MNSKNRSSSMNDLLSTVRQLFPDASVESARLGKGGPNLRLVPGRRRPRLAVPASNIRAASDALLRPSASDTLLTSSRRLFLAKLLASPVTPVAMPYGIAISTTKNSIVDYLSEVIGEQVDISLMIGSARANRKPILNVHSRTGSELGFAKVSLSELTEDLVVHEGETLEQLSQRASEAFVHPTVIHAGQWNGHQVLLLTALRPDKQQKKSRLDLATVAGIIQTADITHMPIESSCWHATLLESAEPLRGTTDGKLPRLLEAFSKKYGAVEIPFGAWHGDFGPWNMAYTSSAPMIWDWERYDSQVPAGMDVLHYLSHELLRMQDREVAHMALEANALPQLAQVLRLATGVSQADTRVLKAIQLAYLLSVGTRFTLDSRRPGGSPIRGLAQWYLAMVEDQLERPVPAELSMK